MPGPGGDLGGWHAGVEPPGDAGVPQIVGAPVRWARQRSNVRRDTFSSSHASSTVSHSSRRAGRPGKASRTPDLDRLIRVTAADLPGMKLPSTQSVESGSVTPESELVSANMLLVFSDTRQPSAPSSRVATTSGLASPHPASPGAQFQRLLPCMPEDLAQADPRNGGRLGHKGTNQSHQNRQIGAPTRADAISRTS